MFSVGDKILYPMHGAGIIEAIEKMEVLGEFREYYVLKLAVGNLDVMVPVDTSGDVGIRHVIQVDELGEVFRVLQGETSQMSRNWNRRYRENMDLLKTGNILNTAQVVRNLVRVDCIKKLSTGEKKMLKSARQILESEMVLVAEKTPEEIRSCVNETILSLPSEE